MKELVSVYMPTKNRSLLVKRAVLSVLNQTYFNIELIVVDDGSTDDTFLKLLELSEKDNRLIVLRNEKSQGACAARNMAIKESKGEYITGLDDDDFFLPHRIESCINFIKKNNVDIVHTNIFLLDGDKKEQFKRKVVCYESLKSENLIGNQIFSRAHCFKILGGFDESLKIMQDYELWLRMLKKFGPSFNEGSASMVVDVAHENFRITENKINYLNESKNIISRKNGFSIRENFIFDLNLLAYGLGRLRIKDLLKYYKFGIFKKSTKLYLKGFLQ